MLYHMHGYLQKTIINRPSCLPSPRKGAAEDSEGEGQPTRHGDHHLQTQHENQQAVSRGGMGHKDLPRQAAGMDKDQVLVAMRGCQIVLQYHNFIHTLAQEDDRQRI